MANTKIEWATKVWNPVTGCTPISSGCANCYAKRMANRLKGRHGYDAADPFKVTIHPEEKFLEPLKWRKPSNVFVCSMGDLFHKDVPTLEIDKVFAIAAISPKHNFMFLTKRPDRMAAYFDTPAKKLAERWEDVIYSMGISAGDDEIDTVASFLHNRCALGWPLKNIWLGVSVEDQKAADDRIHYLNEISAAVKFVICEPLLSEINFEKSLGESLKWHAGGLKNCISWVISGGETGPQARPCHPDWVRSLRDQCKNDGIPFFFKSWGVWVPSLQIVPSLADKSYIGPIEKSTSKDFFTTTCCVLQKTNKKISGDFIDSKQYHEFPKI